MQDGVHCTSVRKHHGTTTAQSFDRSSTLTCCTMLVWIACHHGVMAFGPEFRFSRSPTSLSRSLNCLQSVKPSAQSQQQRQQQQAILITDPPPLEAAPVAKKRKVPPKTEADTTDTSVAAKKEKATKRKPKQSEPVHWLVESDEVVLHQIEEALSESALLPPLSLLRFTVRGNPLPLRRHRTSRGFVYNPSAASQKSFREAVQQLMMDRGVPLPSMGSPSSELSVSKATKATIESSSITLPTPTTPLFWGPECALAVTIIFRMKRPNNHFVAGKRGPDRLRPTAPNQTSGNLRTDVDNLAKFVLDSLNGVLYADDRQIASLHVTKLLDNDVDELCLGSTCVCIRLLQDKDVPRLLSSSLDLY
jgi:Endodeoxyribonuclease RusA